MKTGLVKNRTYCFLGAINQAEAKPSVAGEESPVNGSVESFLTSDITLGGIPGQILFATSDLKATSQKLQC